MCVVFVMIELFYIFFLSNAVMRSLLVVGILSIELVAVLSGFTVVSALVLFFMCTHLELDSVL